MLLIKRTKNEVENDRDAIKGLILKNKSPKEISQELGIPYPLVVSDLNAISKRWQEAVIDLDISKAEQLEKLNLLEKELWASWEKSKTETRKSTLTARSQAGSQNPRDRTEEIIEETPGDVRYIEQIMKIIQERNKLLGIYAAVKTQAELTIKRDDKAIREEVLNIIEDARQRALKNADIINTIETTAGTYVPVDSQKQLQPKEE